MSSPEETMRRKGALGIHSIDHFALDVPDLAEARRFYDLFGLDVREKDGRLELYTFGHPHRWAVLRQGQGPKRLAYLSFGVYAEDMGAFRQRLEGEGIDFIDPPAGAEPDGIWFRGFDGLPINVRIADKATARKKAKFGFFSSEPGKSGAVPNSAAPRVHPRRLSHFALFCTDVNAGIDFYERTLGLRLSDKSEPIVGFLHGPHGSDHHLLALLKSSHVGMHHCSWDVGSIAEAGLGGTTMARHGYKRGWGLGQHVLGANYFYYVGDPWGSFAEYSADIDYIPHDVDWPAANWPEEDSFYLWGPDPAEDFPTNHEPAEARA